MDQDTLKLKLRQLVDYAKDNLSLRAEDEAFVTNSLLSTFSLGAPSQQSAPYDDFQSDIVDPIVEYAVQNGMAKDEE